MRYIEKRPGSIVVINKWRYPTHRVKILEQLEIEQSFYCAYTEYRFDPGHARDIEHFNPNLKGTALDGYDNWYAVSHRWNNKIKGVKWYPPCYSPSDRIVSICYRYEDGYYLYDKNDIMADNLANLVGLNEYSLVEERAEFIKSLAHLRDNGIDLESFFRAYPKRIVFRTAIETVFGFLP